jgi:hypothetical protein
MNGHKRILSLGLITLGAIVGGSIVYVTSGGVVVGGIMLGGLLGGLLFCMIQWAIARRQQEVLPYDRLDERHQANNHGATQTPEARMRRMQDDQLIEVMHVPPIPHK